MFQRFYSIKYRKRGQPSARRKISHNAHGSFHTANISTLNCNEHPLKLEHYTSVTVYSLLSAALMNKHVKGYNSEKQYDQLTLIDPSDLLWCGSECLFVWSSKDRLEKVSGRKPCICCNYKTCYFISWVINWNTVPDIWIWIVYGDMSNIQSFTRTYDWKALSPDLTKLVNLAMQSLATSAKDKREAGILFRSLTVL